MIALDLQNSTVCDFRDLAPGQLFLYTSRREHSLGIAMAKENDEAMWLVLTGEKAFQLYAAPPEFRLHVLPLNLEPGALKLRIDPGSAASNYSEHKPGQLLFPTKGPPSIAAVWPEYAAKGYCNVVTLDGWRQEQESEPRFLIDRWALSYVDPRRVRIVVAPIDPILLAAMKEGHSGPIRKSIQGQSGGAVVAAGERDAGGSGA